MRLRETNPKRYYKENRTAILKAAKEYKQRQRENDPIGTFASDSFFGARQRARTAGIEFSITREDIKNVFPKDFNCPIFGTPFVMARGDYSTINNPDCPSLDRVIPLLGYVPGNIAVISRRANSIKNDASVIELRKVAYWLEKQT